MPSADYSHQSVFHLETSRPFTFLRLTLPPLADAADCRSLTNESAMRHGTQVDVIEVLIAMPFAMRMKPHVLIVSNKRPANPPLSTRR